MAHHLVYVPLKPGTPRGQRTTDLLESVGLADHAAGCDSRPVGDGPDGTGGVLFGWLRPGAKFHFNSAEQEWFPAAACGDLPPRRYWVGTWNDAPPTEQDLRRPGVLYGDDVTLGDGQPWMIPAPHFLPHDLMLQEDGTLRHEPKQRYQAVSVAAARWRRMLAGGPQSVPYEELFRFALDCLALNYRLPAELASRLRLVDTENVKSVVLAACKAEG